MNIFTFDIESIPDIELGKRLYDLDDLSDEEVAKILFHIQAEKTGSSFLPPFMQRIVCISIVIQSQNSTQVLTLGREDNDEKAILNRFYAGLEKYRPTLVTWNGGGFDLPVLQYRALKHGVSSRLYWETGEHDNSFRYNNYLSRFHSRHTDLMDVIANYQNRAFASLDNISALIGLPGKMGVGGDRVWTEYLNNNLEGICDYCEIDVINTYLIYLRFQYIRTNLSEQEYAIHIERLMKYLDESGKAHFAEYRKKML